MNLDRLRSKARNYTKYARTFAIALGGGIAKASPLWQGEWIIETNNTLRQVASYERIWDDRIAYKLKEDV